MKDNLGDPLGNKYIYKIEIDFFLNLKLTVENISGKNYRFISFLEYESTYVWGL